MKKFKHILFPLIFGISSSHACIHVDQEKIKQARLLKEQKQRLLSENFSENGQCITSPENFEQIKKEFKELIKVYFYDLDLQLKYKDFLLTKKSDASRNDDWIEAMEIWAKVILSRTKDKKLLGDQTNDEVRDTFNFTTTLSSLIFKVNEQQYRLPIVNIISYLNTISLNPLALNIQKENFKEFEKNIFLVFKLLSKKRMICDALISIFDKLSMKQDVKKLFFNILYHSNAYQSPYLTLGYCVNNLFPNKEYNLMIEKLTMNFDHDLDDNLDNNLYNYDKIELFYGTLGNAYTRIFNYSKAKESFEKFLEYEDHKKCLLPIVILINISLIQKDYLEAIKWLEQILTFSKEELSKEKVSINWIEKTYLTVLQAGNQTQKTTQIILENQKEFLKKRLIELSQKPKKRKLKPEIIKLIQQGQEALKLSQQKEEEARIKKISKDKQSIQLVPENSQEYIIPYKEEKYIPLIPKEKIKTRGTSSSQTLTVQAKPNKELFHKIKIETLLNSQKYEIFCKFFKKYSHHTKDENVSISFQELQTLFKSLNQDIDRSKGKGSHSKLTFDPLSIEGLRDHINKEVKIISNRSNLLAYQIKTFRKMFIGYGLYPCYLEDKLIEKGLLIN